MSRKILIDGSPGIDEAMVLSIALFHPELELVAATSVGGRVSDRIASQNLHGLIEVLDPPKYPRIGVGGTIAADTESVMTGDADLLEAANLPMIERRAPCSADRVICDAVHASPHEVTILTTGPVTNLMRAFQRDPELPLLIRRVVVTGGTVIAPGDLTALAEFNIFHDAAAARELFRSPMTKTLVPLDVTNRLHLSYTAFEQFPGTDSRVGRLLREILPPAFRQRRAEAGCENVRCNGLIALLTILAPHLFTTRLMSGDVETMGGLAQGATLFDRRDPPQWVRNIDVVTGFAWNEGLEPLGNGPVLQLLYESLEAAARATLDFHG